MEQTMVQQVDALVQEGQQRFAHLPASLESTQVIQLASYVGAIHEALRVLAAEVDRLRAG